MEMRVGNETKKRITAELAGTLAGLRAKLNEIHRIF
jgi:hypothetical protein